MNTRRIAVLAAALPVLLAAVAVADDQGVGPNHPFTRAFRNVAPAVVRVTSGARHASGLLVSADGLIVTHRGIIRRNVMSVIFPDGPTRQARVLIRDDATQLAVLRLLADPADNPAPQPAEPGKDQKPRITVAPIGTSANLKTGAWVATVAYPFGADQKVRQQPSLSAGLLAARGKIPTKLKGYDGDLLLTDAAVNAGSEGGALVDSRGQVVALLCVPQYHAETRTALNVALPVEVLPALLKRAVETPDPPIVEEDFATRKHGFLGIFRAPNAAKCVVGGVIADSPAEKAGLMPGDVITAIDDKKVGSFEDLITVLKETKPGDTIRLTVRRAGTEKPLELDVELAKYPEEE